MFQQISKFQSYLSKWSYYSLLIKIKRELGQAFHPSHLMEQGCPLFLYLYFNVLCYLLNDLKYNIQGLDLLRHTITWD